MVVVGWPLLMEPNALFAAYSGWGCSWMDLGGFHGDRLQQLNDYHVGMGLEEDSFIL